MPSSTSFTTWPLIAPRTATDVWNASYTDFVAMTNEINVPPGGYETLHTWADYSGLNKRSNILEVACTTGFSSRELSRMRGCKATGFDLSACSVALAQFNNRKDCASRRLRYIQANGLTFATKEEFTHVVVGGSLGFFPDPRAMVGRLERFLKPGGHVLASPYWAIEDLPEDLEQLRRETFGLSSPMKPRDEVLKMFNGMKIAYRAHKRLHPESEEEIEEYCARTVDNACRESGIKDHLVQAAMMDRARQIRITKNKLRPYQGFSVLVLERIRNQMSNLV